MLRLKELYSNVSRDKDRLADENRQLRGVLALHLMALPARADPDDAASNPSGGRASATTSPLAPGSQATLSPSRSTAASVTSSAHPASLQPMTGAQMRSAAAHASKGKGVDFEQAGIDFVLAHDGSASTRAYLSPPPQ